MLLAVVGVAWCGAMQPVGGRTRDDGREVRGFLEVATKRRCRAQRCSRIFPPFLCGSLLSVGSMMCEGLGLAWLGSIRLDSTWRVILCCSRSRNRRPAGQGTAVFFFYITLL